MGLLPSGAPQGPLALLAQGSAGKCADQPFLDGHSAARSPGNKGVACSGECLVLTLAEPHLAQAGELNWTNINHTRSRVKACWRHLTKIIHLAVWGAGSPVEHH